MEVATSEALDRDVPFVDGGSGGDRSHGDGQEDGGDDLLGEHCVCV